jgi:hypothetical protein
MMYDHFLISFVELPFVINFLRKFCEATDWSLKKEFMALRKSSISQTI